MFQHVDESSMMIPILRPKLFILGTVKSPRLEHQIRSFTVKYRTKFIIAQETSCSGLKYLQGDLCVIKVGRQRKDEVSELLMDLLVPTIARR